MADFCFRTTAPEGHPLPRLSEWGTGTTAVLVHIAAETANFAVVTF